MDNRRSDEGLPDDHAPTHGGDPAADELDADNAVEQDMIETVDPEGAPD